MLTLVLFLVTGAPPETDVIGRVKTEPGPEDPLQTETLVKVKSEPADPETSQPSSAAKGTDHYRIFQVLGKLVKFTCPNGVDENPNYASKS